MTIPCLIPPIAAPLWVPVCRETIFAEGSSTRSETARTRASGEYHARTRCPSLTPTVRGAVEVESWEGQWPSPPDARHCAGKPASGVAHLEGCTKIGDTPLWPVPDPVQPEAPPASLDRREAPSTYVRGFGTVRLTHLGSPPLALAPCWHMGYTPCQK